MDLAGNMTSGSTFLGEPCCSRPSEEALRNVGDALRAIDVKSGETRDECSSRGEFGAVTEVELGGDGGKGNWVR